MNDTAADRRNAPPSHVLAIEPDPVQADRLRRLFRERIGSTIEIVGSKDEALSAIGQQVPDLILVTALMSPRDEEEFAGCLRRLENADHLQTLTIPQLSSPTRARAAAFFGRRKKQPVATDSASVFAEQVVAYLGWAHEIRNERSAKMLARPEAGVHVRPPAAPATPAAAQDEAPSDAALESLSDAGVDAMRAVEPDLADADLPANGSTETAASDDAGPTIELLEPVFEVIDPIAGFDEVGERGWEELTLDDYDASPTSLLQRPPHDVPDLAERPALETTSAVATPDDGMLSVGLQALRDLDRYVEERAAIARANPREDALASPATSDEDSLLVVEAIGRDDLNIRSGSDLAEAQAYRDLIRVIDTPDRPHSAGIIQVEPDRPMACEADPAATDAAASTTLTPVPAEERRALMEEFERLQADAEERRRLEMSRVHAEAAEALEAAVAQARDAAEAEARDAVNSELARVREEAERKLSETLSRVRSETEHTVAAEVMRARAEAEEMRLADLTRVQREAEDRLQAELSRVRSETERARAEERAATMQDAERVRERAMLDARAELLRVQQEAEERLQEELSRVRAETERLQAEALSLVRSETEHAVAAEVMRARTEAEEKRLAEVSRVQRAAEERLRAELSRVQSETEQKRAQERTAAMDQAERVLERAVLEARATAEDAATATLKTEIARVQADADARLVAEMQRVRDDATLRQDAELTAIKAQIAEVRETAARQARIAARQVLEVARATSSHDAMGAHGLGASTSTAHGAPNFGSGRDAKWGVPKGAPSQPAAASSRPLPSSAGSYYNLWRSESPPAAPTPAPAQAPAVHVPAVATAPKNRPWGLPLAASLVLVSSGGVMINTAYFPPPAQIFETRSPDPLGPPKPAPVAPAPKRSAARAAKPAGRLPGWVAIFSRIPLEIHVDGKVIGTTDDGELMVPAGTRDVTFVSDTYNFRQTVRLTVRSGFVTSHTVTLPGGLVRIFAPAGAHIWVDGEAVRDTTGDVLVPIGTREVVMRHPDAGERRQTVEVRARETTEVVFE